MGPIWVEVGVPGKGATPFRKGGVGGVPGAGAAARALTTGTKVTTSHNGHYGMSTAGGYPPFRSSAFPITG